MTSQTITITDRDALHRRDVVTLRKDGYTVTGPKRECMGNVHVELQGATGRTKVDACTDDGWEFVSATREVPEVEPGTAGTADTPNGPGERVMRTSPRSIEGRGLLCTVWVDHEGNRLTEGEVESFVPDAPAPLPTRDEIAQALHQAWWTAMEHDLPMPWTDVDPVTRRGFLAEADTAIALLTGGST